MRATSPPQKTTTQRGTVSEYVQDQTKLVPAARDRSMPAPLRGGSRGAK